MDDWRVTVVLLDARSGWPADMHLLEHDSSLPASVEISQAGGRIYAYPDTESDAVAARQTLERFFAQRAVPVQTVLERWNPRRDEWVDPSLPLEPPDEPRGEFDIAAFPWEVRARLPSHERAAELKERLRRDGHPALDTRTRLSVLAADEQQAADLADRVRIEGGVTSGVSVRRVSRFRRWWLAQRWYGNYGLGGGEIYDAGDGGGGGGNGGG